MKTKGKITKRVEEEINHVFRKRAESIKHFAHPGKIPKQNHFANIVNRD